MVTICRAANFSGGLLSGAAQVCVSSKAHGYMFSISRRKYLHATKLIRARHRSHYILQTKQSHATQTLKAPIIEA